MKTKKEAKFIGIFAVAFGGICLGVMAVIYFQYGDFLDSQMKATVPNPEVSVLMIKALKAAAFKLVPGICLVLIGSGIALLKCASKIRNDD